MDFFNALRGQKGQHQAGSETVDRLCDRIEHGTLLEDRRAAVLALKACSRDHRKVERLAEEDYARSSFIN
jgi:hypothetical protein